MTKIEFTQSEQPQERFGRAVAARLSDSTAELPYHVAERLRAARTQAIAKRKLASAQSAPVILGSGSAATLGFSLWRRIASAVPLVMLAAGLILINTVQNERRASEVAEVDAALLTDDLPPAAYADPGFAQFLKAGTN